MSDEITAALIGAGTSLVLFALQAWQTKRQRAQEEKPPAPTERRVKKKRR